MVPTIGPTYSKQANESNYHYKSTYSRLNIAPARSQLNSQQNVLSFHHFNVIRFEMAPKTSRIDAV